MPYVVVHVTRHELRQLRQLAEAEDRTPAQQAQRLLRQALTLAQKGGESHEPVTRASAGCRTDD